MISILKKIYSEIRKFYNNKYPLLEFSDEEIEKYSIINKQEQAYLQFAPEAFVEKEHLKHFKIWQNQTEDEYIFHYTKGCLIEPREGWAITNDRKIIWQSVPNGYKDWSKASPPTFFDWRFKQKKTKHFDKLISLNYIYRGGNNYWHFFNDILGQLALLKANNVDLSIPILIHKNIVNSNLFKDVLERSQFLSSINWIVHTDFHIKAKEVYFAKNLPYLSVHFKQVLEWLNIPEPDFTSNDKIFLTRKAGSKRSISNFKEVEQIVEQNGFRVVDTEGMTLNQQIDIFSKASKVIAVHGAGVTNLMYRKSASLKFLEIFPADYITPCFYIFARDFGHDYNCVVGGNLENGTFKLEQNYLDKKIKAFFELQ